MQPLLKSVYDNKKAMEPYAKMNFYDVNAKLVHRFSESDRLSAVFYWGKDVSNSSPTDSETNFGSKSGETRTKKMRQKQLGQPGVEFVLDAYSRRPIPYECQREFQSV